MIRPPFGFVALLLFATFFCPVFLTWNVLLCYPLLLGIAAWIVVRWWFGKSDDPIGEVALLGIYLGMVIVLHGFVLGMDSARDGAPLTPERQRIARSMDSIGGWLAAISATSAFALGFRQRQSPRPEGDADSLDRPIYAPCEYKLSLRTDLAQNDIAALWSMQAEDVVRDLMAHRTRRSDWFGEQEVMLDALFIPGGWTETWFLRPSGEVFIVGDDDEHDSSTVGIYTDRGHILGALNGGGRRYAELLALLPVRGPDGIDCFCVNHPQIFGPGKVICSECGGVGWLPPPPEPIESSGNVPISSVRDDAQLAIPENDVVE